MGLFSEVGRFFSGGPSGTPVNGAKLMKAQQKIEKLGELGADVKGEAAYFERVIESHVDGMNGKPAKNPGSPFHKLENGSDWWDRD
jgi:hypothetical protein